MFYRLNICTVFFLFCFSSSVLHAQLPSNYQHLSAEMKQDLLWNEIDKSHQEEPLPELSGDGFWGILDKLKGLFNLAPSFDHVSDELPEGRVKIIHTNGSVGKIAFRSASGHPFTGIYQSGGIGLARLSLATKPSDDSYTPGMAVKFLLPNQASVNLQVMNCLDGQGSNWNFFAKDFSNEIPHPKSWTLKAIEKIFEWTRKPANKLPLSHLAKWNNKGEEIADPVAPERIYFKPSALVKHVIAEDSREDFRTSFLNVGFGTMYDVYGDYAGTEYYIGDLLLESQLLASNYGDKVLFFQHQR